MRLGNILTILLLIFLLQARPIIAGESTQQSGFCTQWAVTVWGISYHPNIGVPYNNYNWGIGGRCYTSLRWKWFGNPDNHNRIFLQTDGMEDSYSGLLVPVSIGTEYLAKTFGEIRLSFTGTFTVAYYSYSDGTKPDIEWGPVPSISLGYRNVQTNLTFIPKPAKPGIKAVTASLTILLPQKNNPH